LAALYHVYGYRLAAEHDLNLLMELLVVIAIIAVLMAILMPALQRVKEQAREVACIANLQWGSLIHSHNAAAIRLGSHFLSLHNGYGWGQFHVNGGSASVWTPQRL